LKYIAVLLMGFVYCANAMAAPVTIYEFKSKENEALFYKLSDEIRCLVCQNQNIAESNSELAQDLRRQIYDMLKQDKTEDEIIGFMVERYGDYVLFNPPFKPLTWMLWLGPLILFILAGIYAIRIVAGQRKSEPGGDELSAEEVSRLSDLKSELFKSQQQDSPQQDPEQHRGDRR